MAKEYKLSPQRLKELQDEMNYLKTVREKEVAELIKEILSNYVVIEEEPSDGSSVRLGSTVTVLDEEFDETMVYKIVGSQEADPMNGAISEDSPFGKALLGKSEGDQVVVDAPAGRIEYKLLKVEQR